MTKAKTAKKSAAKKQEATDKKKNHVPLPILKSRLGRLLNIIRKREDEAG